LLGCRNPAKHQIKNIFLDGIGEDPASPRRSTSTGLQAHYTMRHSTIISSSSTGKFAADFSGGGDNDHEKEIEMILLDERYFRETFACSQRREW
jgi:hypothetical protein